MVAEWNRPFDSDECERFYREHQSWLRAMVKRNVGQGGDIEDVLQSFILRLMEKPVPETVIAERGYCYKMLKNFIIDIKRSDKSYNKNITDFAQVHAWLESYDPFKKAATTDEFCHILKKAIKYLPPRIALAVKLRLIKDYTTEEIAEKMSVNERTATKYVSDGKKMLRDILCRFFYIIIFSLIWILIRCGESFGLKKG